MCIKKYVIFRKKNTCVCMCVHMYVYIWNVSRKAQSRTRGMRENDLSEEKSGRKERSIKSIWHAITRWTI